MWDLFIADLVEIGYTIRIAHMAMPIGVLLWLAIVFLPVSRLDPRDIYCAMTYMVFHMAVGVALILALPDRYIGDISMQTQILIVLAMFLVVSGRWFLRKEALQLMKAQYAAATDRRRRDQPWGDMNDE